jgi:hypothetical protein
VVDWKRAIEEERAMLMRIVALVLALADLAELACSRPLAIRGFVFWILHRAELAVREFVADPADAPSATAARSGDLRADLAHLAARFRQLAHEVKRLARPALSLRDSDAGRTEPSPPRAGRMLRLVDAVEALDFLRPVPCARHVMI